MGGNNVVGRRLSKPRTNTSSSNLLSSPDTPGEVSSPIASSDMDYFGEHATTVSSQGERRSRRKSRTKLRAYLYGSSSHESSQSLSSDEDEERQNGLAGAARGAKKRISRTGSSIMQLSSAKASTNYLSCGSSSNLLTSNAEDSVRVAEQIKERARLDTIAAQNHVSSPVDEDKHVDSVAAPLRRKSLYTPGIATRQSSDILRKPPPPQSIQSQADRDYYYNPAYPESSPLAQLAALNISDDGRSTPTMNVTHLGGLQLGSLRVTNGTASPIPQDTISALRHLSPTPSSNLPEDFQTASEGSDNEGRATPRHANRSLQNPAIKPSSSTVDLFLPASQGITNLRQEEQFTYSKRTSFPFHQKPSDPAPAIANEYMSELDGSPFSYSETRLSQEATVPQDRFEEEGIILSSSQEPGVEALRSIINDADSRSASNGTTEDAFSKLNGSSVTSRYSTSMDSVPKADSGYSSNASLGASQHGVTNRDVINPPKSQRSALQTRAVSGPREMPLVKSRKEADIFSVDNPLQVRPSFTVIPRYALAEPEPSVTSTGALETISNFRSSARSPSQVLVRKLQKARPKSQPPPTPPIDTITVQRYRDLEQIHIPRVPSLIAARHAERLVQFPLLDHTFPSSEHVSTHRSPTLDESYPVPVRFPSPANALEAAAFGLPNSPPPSRPADILSSKSRKGVAVDGDDDDSGSSSLVRSPSWSAFGGGKQKKLQKKAIKEQREAEKRLAKEEKELERRLTKDRKDLEKQIKRDESKDRSSRSRRSSWGRAKSSERAMSERDARATISDFGTVTQSLGGSPYDIAKPTQTQPFTFVPQQNNWHPHQISTAMPRPKSMVGMENTVPAGAIGARGRTRSQSIGRPTIPVDEIFGDESGKRGRKVQPQTMFVDVHPMPALSAVDIRQYDIDWACRQRTRSASRPREEFNEAIPFNDRGGVPGKVTRPQSMFVDAPPVPALPSLQQVKQREAALTRSRPQSMMIDAPGDRASTDSGQSANVPRTGLATPPRKSRISKMAVPDLWTSGSLEKKSSKPLKEQEAPMEHTSSAVELDTVSSGNNMWEAQRQAWREHRKSAGEALLLKNQLNDIFASADPASAAAPTQKPCPRSTITRSVTADPSDLVSANNKRLSPSPLAPYTSNPTPMPYQSYEERTPSFPTPAERRAQNPSYRIPRKRVGSGAFTPRATSSHRSSMAIPASQPMNAVAAPTLPASATVVATSTGTRLMGRYEGGLLYGYEPGQGLGGSAGTRGTKTEASRKSVDVSKGFGIDLSDIPIFVAPAMR